MTDVIKSGEKFYVEIKPDTEIVRVESEEQLKSLNDYKELKELPPTATTAGELPPLKEDEVCAHWEREVIYLSDVNFELSKKHGEKIVGGYCPDCGKNLGQPKSNWYPRISYKK